MPNGRGGIAISPDLLPGVSGVSDKGPGVEGQSNSNSGVVGESKSADGVLGYGKNGVHGESSSPSDSGVWANNTGGGYGVAGTSDKPGGIGVYGRGQQFAAMFDGAVKHNGKCFHQDIEVTGQLNAPNSNIQCQDVSLVGSDCAENFEVFNEFVDPGTVMVVNKEGLLEQSCNAYDRKVAGIVSGAGNYKAGITLGRTNDDRNTRIPIALIGKVYCKADATTSSIEIGDLLTTSSTPGHAMKADDPAKAFGAVIGKALGSIKDGLGMIPVLVALQ